MKSLPTMRGEPKPEESESVADWRRIHAKLADPEVREENRRVHERKERAESKKRDTGL